MRLVTLLSIYRRLKYVVGFKITFKILNVLKLSLVFSLDMNIGNDADSILSMFILSVY